jgi:FlaA1/EpsC-like NDP-sugar epimerase
VKSITSALRRAQNKTKLLIYGAGQCGSLVGKDILDHKELNYSLVAFVDDFPFSETKRLLGRRIVSRSVASQMLSGFDEILIAIPSISADRLRSITDWCNSTGKPFRIIPGFYQLLEQKAYPGTARNVILEDLLDRKTRKIDTDLLKTMYANKTIMVTGAGGSIGGILCQQLIQLQPKALLLLDASESNLFFLDQDLLDSGSTSHIPVLGNVCDSSFLDTIFSQYKPQIVFHAAAYKHVPMLESNVSLAVLNNVVSTNNLLALAEKYDVDRFVQISTDKAVNPKNIMGATKRICELLVKDKSSSVIAMNVRFGNVLGSSGSLIPVIRKRIAKGLPIHITDRRMRRFFMSIPEAASLVLHVGANGDSGSVYVLDMGEDYLVLDIIKQIIRLEGSIPEQDIEIIEIGLRPGEKLVEILSANPEHLKRTSHPSINVDVDDPMPWAGFSGWVNNLIAVAESYDDKSVREILGKLISKDKDSSNE